MSQQRLMYGCRLWPSRLVCGESEHGVLLEKRGNPAAKAWVTLTPVPNPDPANLWGDALAHQRRSDALDETLLPRRIKGPKASTSLHAM
jgi:hypothetical protein